MRWFRRGGERPDDRGDDADAGGAGRAGGEGPSRAPVQHDRTASETHAYEQPHADEHEHPHEHPRPHPHADAAAATGADGVARPRLAIVGAGRVGLTLAIAFSRAGWPVAAIASRDALRREAARDAVPGARVFHEAASVVDEADLVFLTVPDDAIAEVCASLRLYSGQGLVHTSGLLTSAVLAPALAAGTAAASFHPLVAFADTQRALAVLRAATVALEGDEPLIAVLADLATAIGASPVRIGAEGKAAYHAAAMLAAGGFVGLLDVIAELARGAGLDEAGSLAIYAPLLRQTLANAEVLGIAGALTGPVVRGDIGTIRAHRAAMELLAPDAEDLYRAAAKREIRLAEGRGDLTPAAAAHLRASLAKAD